MKLYRGYKGWRKIPFLFKLFHNPYEFGYVDWIKWKYLDSELYRSFMRWYLSTKPRAEIDNWLLYHPYVETETSIEEYK